MTIPLPHRIKNHLGEEIIFHRYEAAPKGEKLIFETYLDAGARPVTRTYRQQEVGLTVVHGKLGYQVDGEEPRIAGIGETVVFAPGKPLKFWNAGDKELNCYGWITPPQNIIFQLTLLFHSINESGTERPEQFSGAFLLHRYRNEFDMPHLPRFVKKVVIPATYGVGKITGRYKKFKNAPAPLL